MVSLSFSLSLSVSLLLWLLVCGDVWKAILSAVWSECRLLWHILVKCWRISCKSRLHSYLSHPEYIPSICPASPNIIHSVVLTLYFIHTQPWHVPALAFYEFAKIVAAFLLPFSLLCNVFEACIVIGMCVPGAPCFSWSGLIRSHLTSHTVYSSPFMCVPYAEVCTIEIGCLKLGSGVQTCSP